MKQPANAELLNEDELLFLWKGLVENGQLSPSKLMMFMQQVAGVNMSVVQARDLLNYMDANGDGRVGMEDFKNFLSIGHLSETDAKAFMWEPKKKYQEEYPSHKVVQAPATPATPHEDAVHQEHHPDHHHEQQHSHRHEHHRGSEHHEHHHHRSTMASADHHDRHDHHRGTMASADHHERGHHYIRHEHHQHVPVGRRSSLILEDGNDHGFERSHSKPLTPPETKAPSKRRPHHGLHHTHTRPSLMHMETQASLHSSSTAKTEEAPKKPKPPPITPETEKKIEQALLKYEQQIWEKLLIEEKQFKRQLFEQFAGPGGTELEVTEYHKMLMKWIPLASWAAPRGLRPADSLAALEYVIRRDAEERGAVSQTPAQTPNSTSTPAADASSDGTESQQLAALAPAAEVKMSYGLWLDVLNGKHRPEEHICDIRSSPHAPHLME